MKKLLKQVDKAFDIKNKPYSYTYLYSMGRIYGRWRFTVTDDWHHWFKCKFQTEFDSNTPEGAVRLFLYYIDKNNINPAILRYDYENETKISVSS